MFHSLIRSLTHATRVHLVHSEHWDAAMSRAEGAGIVVGTIKNEGPKGECAQHSMQMDAVETNQAE